MATDKLDAEKWAKRYIGIHKEEYAKVFGDVYGGWTGDSAFLQLLHDKIAVGAMRRFISELPQFTAGTIGAEEIVRGWWNEVGGKSGSVQPENITAMTIKRREIDELIERLSVLASIPATRMPSETIDEALAIIQSALMNLSLDEPDVTMAKKNLVKINNLIQSLGGVK